MTPAGPFPAGSYTFPTYLLNISASCVTNPSAFICPPANQTYSQSTSVSAATFQWIVNATSPSPPSSDSLKNTYTISSTDNPFSITFPPTKLDLINQGTNNECYSFTASSLRKITYPRPGIKCYFNNTMLVGHFYTRKAPSLSNPAASSASSSANPATPTGIVSGGYTDWGHAVDVTQSINGGSGVPDCYEWNNGVLGAPVTQGFEAKRGDGAGQCECYWANSQ